MTKQRRRQKNKAKPAALTLRVTGPDVRDGRIPVPDLLVLCQHAQSAVNRQAEALEGKQTLRPGPKIGKVREECLLELVSLAKGSAILGFDQAMPQQQLPEMATLGADAIFAVGEVIESLGKGRPREVDPGVLHSLKDMGDLFANGVRSVQWIVPPRAGKRRLRATFNAEVQRRVVQKLRPPTSRPEMIDGVLEMADFKPTDQRCRIHPPLGPAINCTFSTQLADDIYAVLRQPARVEGNAIISTQTGKMESIEITKVTPLDPLTVNAGGFFKGWTLQQLAQMQAIEPLRDPRVLAGGWPEDEDVDDLLTEIYERRD